MKEVILLKDVGKHRKGDKVTIPRGMANYWKRMGVAKDYVKPKRKPKAKSNDKSKEKSNDKPRTTNKSKGKSKS